MAVITHNNPEPNRDKSSMISFLWESMMSSFFDLGVDGHLGDDNQLLKLERLLDWSLFSPILSDIHSADGPTGYDPV